MFCIDSIGAICIYLFLNVQHQDKNNSRPENGLSGEKEALAGGDSDSTKKEPLDSPEVPYIPGYKLKSLKLKTPYYLCIITTG